MEGRIFLPSVLVQEGRIAGEAWPADTQIKTEIPMFWRAEQVLHCVWIENRNHADTKSE
ncbi:hypothetical protein D3C79_1087790 [compost metagenome]